MFKSSRSALPRLAAGCLVGVSALAIASAASAQSTSKKSHPRAVATDQLETVVVTATKRAKPVQRVAQTVNVVSGEELSNLHIQNTIELTRVVGGLALTETSPSEQSISLRGIKEPSGGGPSTETVKSYLNEVPISVFDAFATTLDLANVQVLKGPQGTLRGLTSPSGAVLFTTQKPDFSGYSGYAAATWSSHDGRRVEAAYGGPISDTVAVRLAGVYDYNGLTQVKDIYNHKSNYRETAVTRATVSWQPTERFSADLMVQHTNQTGDFYRQISGTAPCAGDQGGAILVSSIACGRTFTLKDKIALTQGPNPNHYWGTIATLNAHYSLAPNIDVNYVGGVNINTYYTNLNFDFAGVGEVNNFGRYIDVNTHRQDYTNELRIQSNGYSFWNFLFGVFDDYGRVDAIANLPPLFTNRRTASNTNNLGLFTTQNIAITKDDHLVVGLRYSTVTTKNRVNGTQVSYSAVTGNASYQHQFTPDIMGYVSYGTSFRPGSAGALASPRAGVIPASYGNFGSERSRSIELGLKSQWFNRRLTANLALFDQKYTGYITSQFNVACTGVPNPNGLSYATTDGTKNGPTCFGTMLSNGDAVSRGVELELHALVTDNWRLDGILTWTEAHYANANLPCNDYNGDGKLDVNGIAMVQQGKYVSMCQENGPLGSLPKVSFTLNTSYNFMVGDIPAYVQANSHTQSSSFFPQTAARFPGYTTVDASIGAYTPDHNWEISLWAKNLLNRVVQDTDGGPWSIFGVQSGLRIGTVTNDREIGVTLRRTF